jgi:hypothetical protein
MRYAVIVYPGFNGYYGEKFMKKPSSFIKITSSILASSGKPPKNLWPPEER